MKLLFLSLQWDEIVLSAERERMTNNSHLKSDVLVLTIVHLGNQNSFSLLFCLLLGIIISSFEFINLHHHHKICTRYRNILPCWYHSLYTLGQPETNKETNGWTNWTISKTINNWSLSSNLIKHKPAALCRKLHKSPEHKFNKSSPPIQHKNCQVNF